MMTQPVKRSINHTLVYYDHRNDKGCYYNMHKPKTLPFLLIKINMKTANASPIIRSVITTIGIISSGTLLINGNIQTHPMIKITNATIAPRIFPARRFFFLHLLQMDTLSTPAKRSVVLTVFTLSFPSILETSSVYSAILTYLIVSLALSFPQK